jgi:hypothetical protein
MQPDEEDAIAVKMQAEEHELKSLSQQQPREQEMVTRLAEPILPRNLLQWHNLNPVNKRCLPDHLNQ